jgi:CMP-N-acetylneuraminic acid synthetase
MAYENFKILAVIPARGGSKGIPRKNLCRIAGVSLVGHAAKVAQSLEWIDRTVLSTDDEEIAREGRNYGLEVPFMRPAELASDTTRSHDVWKHVWLTSEEHFKEHYDISVLLEPTSPLRRPKDITLTVVALMESNCDAAATVSRAPAHFTPHKCLTLAETASSASIIQMAGSSAYAKKSPTTFFAMAFAMPSSVAPCSKKV